MSNSNLVTYKDTGSGNWNNRTASISGIIIHNAATVGTCEDLSEILSTTTAGSFNYGIATDGTIGLYVDEMHRAWSTGNPEVDHKTVSIVVCNNALTKDYPISYATYNSLLDLCEDICRRNMISELKYTGNRENSNLYMHSWYADVDCPGQFLSKRYKSIAEEITSRLKKSVNNSTTAALACGTGISVDQISPYLILINSGTTKIDLNKLIAAKVVGALLYCGSLYAEGSKQPKSVYRSSSLNAQVNMLSGKMPYGLYCDVRSWDAKSAKQECEQLYYVVSSYPPKLGIWLSLSSTVNDEVVETYYTYFKKWGLSSKCGIYCSRSQLSRINWSGNFCKKYSLWLVDHTTKEGLVGASDATPNFFSV